MSIEGEITVTLHWDGHRVRHLALGSTRPLAAARVLLGRRAADAAALVPRLYAICGHAQGAACAAALGAAAMDSADETGLPDADARAVVLEALQETLWRLLIDAPRSLSLPPLAAAVGPARAAVAQAIAALKIGAEPAQSVLTQVADAMGDIAREHVYGCEPAAWLQSLDTAAFDRWRDTASTLPARALARLAATAHGLGRSDTALMPGLDDAAWWQAVVPAMQQDPLFAQAPTWGGRPVETGALSRLQAHPLVAALVARDGHSAATRLAARLVELASLLADLPCPTGNADGWVRAWPLGPGTGLAAVQTARGLLLHQAWLVQGRISDYRIVAPTEWNFHPQGALFRGIVGTEAPDEATLVARTSLAVHALDPCVGFRIEVVRDA
ncbi:MAG: nickel-dependent hydrogenase large subunit [Rubrivivax sp.]|nr:nickel-dependent hydrogenase large subunit [Rubrivivax sp.]